MGNPRLLEDKPSVAPTGSTAKVKAQKRQGRRMRRPYTPLTLS